MISANARLARAAQTNLQRDAMERQVGFAAASDCDDALLVRTAITALHAGLETEDWDCVAEAADMLAKKTNFYPWRPATRRAKP
jgi:hypothetical protein